MKSRYYKKTPMAHPINGIKYTLAIFLVCMVNPGAFSQSFQDASSNPMQADKIKERLYKDVEKLTSVRPYRNYTNVTTLNAVADYLFMEFDSHKGKPEFQEYIIDGNTYKNVIATFGPEDGPRIVVGAHYDVDGNQPGADDNASGVAGLLEIARMLAHAPQQLQHRVDLVAYTLEEQPFFSTDQMGSAVHAKYLNDNDIPINYMLCLEMIGYYSDEPNSQRYPADSLQAIYPNKGDFILVLGKTGQEGFTNNIKQLMQKNARIGVESINLPGDLNLARLSDHRNYWDFGYDAVMISDTAYLRNPNYHKKSDTIGTLDFEKMTEVVIGVYNVIIGL